MSKKYKLQNYFSKEIETYMYLVGGKRWVDNNLVLVLFKHHCLNRFLHKVTYMSMSDNTKKNRHINGAIRKKILACTKSNISKSCNV